MTRDRAGELAGIALRVLLALFRATCRTIRVRETMEMTRECALFISFVLSHPAGADGRVLESRGHGHIRLNTPCMHDEYGDAHRT